MRTLFQSRQSQASLTTSSETFSGKTNAGLTQSSKLRVRFALLWGWNFTLDPFVILVLQLLHQSRQTLPTYPCTLLFWLLAVADQTSRKKSSNTLRFAEIGCVGWVCRHPMLFWREPQEIACNPVSGMETPC